MLTKSGRFHKIIPLRQQGFVDRRVSPHRQTDCAAEIGPTYPLCYASAGAAIVEVETAPSLPSRQILSAAPGGIETHVQTLARAQSALGADVQVLCVNHADRTGRDITWSAGSTETVDEMDGSVRVKRLGRRASLARLDLCPGLNAALNVILNEPVDVLHLQTPNPTMLLAVARLRTHVPIVVTHQSDVIKQRVLRHALAPFERVVYGRAAKLIASSTPYIDGSPLLKRYRPKVQAVPLGLDLGDLLQPTAAAQARAAAWRERIGSPMWLAVGRCVYYKGFETAVAALPHVPGKLVVVGTGPLQEVLKEMARDFGVQDRVSFCGYADRDELIGAYLASTALWFPSSHRSEAFGLVQVEAMAAGCPVINTSIPHSGVDWVSKHEESGLTVPVGDSDALAAAAKRLIDEPGLPDRLAAGAVRRAKQEFDHLVMARRMLDVYESVLSPAVAT